MHNRFTSPDEFGMVKFDGLGIRNWNISVFELKLIETGIDLARKEKMAIRKFIRTGTMKMVVWVFSSASRTSNSFLTFKILLRNTFLSSSIILQICKF